MLIRLLFLTCLFTFVSSCAVERPTHPERYDFYFSWTQYEETHWYGLCQHKSGKILVYTDWRDFRNKHMLRPYKDGIYIGKGIAVFKNNVNKNAALWPAKPGVVTNDLFEER